MGFKPSGTSRILTIMLRRIQMYTRLEKCDKWETVVQSRLKTSVRLMEWMPSLALLIATPLIVILLYAFHAFCFAKDLVYLGNVMRDAGGDAKHLDIYSYFEAVTKERPKLSMSIECYHMETRTSGSGKNRRSRRVRVVTWRGRREIALRRGMTRAKDPRAWKGTK